MHNAFKIRTFRGDTVAQPSHKVIGYLFKCSSFNACKRSEEHTSELQSRERLGVQEEADRPQ